MGYFNLYFISVAAEQVQSAGAGDERVHQKREASGVFGEFAIGGLDRKIRYQFMLRMPMMASSTRHYNSALKSVMLTALATSCGVWGHTGYRTP